MASTLFWIFAGLLAYIYFGYPLIVVLVSFIFEKGVSKSSWRPDVTVIIPAYNEERHIKETLINKLELDYPEERIEIIVVSDGSTDKTDDIVTGFKDKGVRLIRQDRRQGKTSALNKAVNEAKGEIIVFSDANSLYSKDALKHLVDNFHDETVGYVTGQMIYINKDGSVIGEGCSRYMRYEAFLRKAETRIGSVVGVNGGVDAVRKCLYKPMRPEQIPDLVLPLKVIEQGYRVVYEPEAILKEDALNRSTDEYKMRVRVALRALHAIWDMRHLMNPLKYGLFAWQFCSHKVMRYLTFVLLIALFGLNFLLIWEAMVYKLGFLIQGVFYISAFSGWYLERTGRKSWVLYIPFYFCLLNMASAQAFLKMLLGERAITWTPRGG